MVAEVLTVNQAADLLGMTPVSVRQAIKQGRLRASKFGRDWQIKRVDAEAYRLTPKHAGGRPRSGQSRGAEEGDKSPPPAP